MLYIIAKNNFLILYKSNFKDYSLIASRGLMREALLAG